MLCCTFVSQAHLTTQSVPDANPNLVSFTICVLLETGFVSGPATIKSTHFQFVLPRRQPTSQVMLVFSEIIAKFETLLSSVGTPDLDVDGQSDAAVLQDLLRHAQQLLSQKDQDLVCSLELGQMLLQLNLAQQEVKEKDDALVRVLESHMVQQVSA